MMQKKPQWRAVLALASLGFLAVPWERVSFGQQDVGPPPNAPGQAAGKSTIASNKNTKRDVESGINPPATGLASAALRDLIVTRGVLDEMITMVSQRLKTDPQEIVKNLDEGTTATDVPKAIRRRAQALREMLKALK